MIVSRVQSQTPGRAPRQICATFAWFPVAVWLLAAPETALSQQSGPPATDRVPWTTSRVVGSPEKPAPFAAKRMFPQLEFEQPIAVGRFPGGSLLWVATHQTGYGGPGRIYRFADDQSVQHTTLFHERPEIIYGLAFHPEFRTNGFVYVGCNGRSPTLGKIATRVVRLTLARRPPYAVIPGSEQLIIEWASNGHNGGDVAFGPDGFLYVSAGDGTSDSDRNHAGQDLSTLPGSMLRIDVDEPDPGRSYSIPPDNPFINAPQARGEIWAYGLRNPWRITFDAQTGHLWVGNNGQDLWETVHLVQKGENYGWSVREGNAPFQLRRKIGPTPIVPPTIEHHHAEARSLTGGVVYYGRRFPTLRGAYVYGDYATGNIWAARHNAAQHTSVRKIARASIQIAGFGIDSRGEILIVDHGGALFGLEVNSEPDTSGSFPRRLSETGLYQSLKDDQLASGVVPYSVNSPLWSDGARKQRLIALPHDSRMTFHPSGSWEFEDGAVLVKTFSLNVVDNASVAERKVETRLFTKQRGEWFGYSYAWNAEGTDAELVEPDGRDQTFATEGPEGPVEQVWRFPGRSECMTCHTREARFVLGVSTEQLNRVHRYPGGPINQLTRLAQLGLFRNPPPKEPADYPSLPDPADETAPLAARARSYLHANCANCHVHAGGGNSLMKMRFSTPLGRTAMIDVDPQHDHYGFARAKIIAPGSPDRSVLLHRVTIRGRGRMPPLASSRIDRLGAKLLRQWIETLERPK